MIYEPRDGVSMQALHSIAVGMISAYFEVVSMSGRCEVCDPHHHSSGMIYDLRMATWNLCTQK